MSTATDGVRTAYRTCPLCEATCGLEIQLRGDEVIRIRGDAQDVFSRGFICPKGSTLKKLHDDPDRLRRPLVRKGGELREASWEEAFAAVERGLMPIIEKHGSGAVAAYLGNPNVHNLAGSLYVRPLLKALRTRQIFSASTVDQMPKHVSAGLMFGGAEKIPVPDLDRSDYLLMLGANPWESNGSLCTAPDFPGRLKALQARGGRFVVVDPRRTRSAQEADEHLRIRPGSDVFFLLAMIHTIFDEKLVAKRPLDAHVAGLAEIEALAQEFAPERVAQITGIDAATIRRISREVCAAPSAAVYGRIGTHTVEFGTLASWAVDALNVLSGNLDRPGGAMFPNAAHSRVRAGAPGGRGFALGRWHSRVRGLPEVRGELPVGTFADEILTEGEGQIRALITVGGNPVLSTPDSRRLDRALDSLEFMVSVDPYRNETSRHADVILPPPSALERSHYDLAFYPLAVRNVANYSPPVLPSDAVAESEILARLTLILSGKGAGADPAIVDELLISSVLGSVVESSDSPLAGRDPEQIRAELAGRPPTEQVLDLMLRAGPYGDAFGVNPDGLTLAMLEQNPHGIDLGPLQPRIPEILSTPSGKIELAPEPIVADVERARARLEAGAHEGLLLIGRRDVRSNNSWMHNIDVLVRGRDRCTLQMHPDDASQLGLRDGARAAVRSRVGRVELPVEITEDIMAGVVSIPHGWGHDLDGVALSVAREHAGVNSNELTDAEPIDVLSGNAVLNGIPVTVQPA